MMRYPSPTSCAACAFFSDQGSQCRRHAPPPGQDEFELVYWPIVDRQDRCGDGASVGNGSGPDIPGIVRCHTCRDWFRPDGEGIKPYYRQGLTVQWWAESGYCTRVAPSPSSESDRRTRWKVTHKDDGCGDGEVASELVEFGSPHFETAR